MKKLNVKKLANAAELKAAKRLGGTRQSGSGNKPNQRGDILAVLNGRPFLIDHKQTHVGFFRLTKAMIDKVKLEACRAGREWAFLVESKGVKFFCIDQGVYADMKDKDLSLREVIGLKDQKAGHTFDARCLDFLIWDTVLYVQIGTHYVAARLESTFSKQSKE